MKESRFLEFKSEVSNSFLKTVSAFSNIGTGTIKFGFNDDGSICGISNIEKTCLDIENKINDSITPNPNYKFELDYNNKTIDLIVYEGLNKPYLYKSKAYKRNDTATIEMDHLELQRVILEGKNMYFEELPYDGKLEFNYLRKVFKDNLNVELNDDIFKTLGLVDKNGNYNNAAAILADENNFSGIDIIRFGNNINEIMDRGTLEGKSIFEQYNFAFDYYNKNYVYELIDGPERKVIHKIPENAFREALANALIHRTWDDTPNIRISMLKDRITITSPGGLLSSVSKEEYLNGQVSKLRNPIIAHIFFRLKMIEMFGTGILRIKDLYKDLPVQPDFKIYDNSITVELPTIDSKLSVSKDEQIILDYLNKGLLATSGDIVIGTGLSKDKVLRLMKNLINNGYVKVSGVGKATKYSI
jgi:ATP-dependent DNA helicase RecG